MQLIAAVVDIVDQAKEELECSMFVVVLGSVVQVEEAVPIQVVYTADQARVEGQVFVKMDYIVDQVKEGDLAFG